MSDLILQSVETSGVVASLPAVPLPRVPLNIRPAVAGDLAFVDKLQKMHTKAVGWMPTSQLEGSIKAGRVLIAEMRNDECTVQSEGKGDPAMSSFSAHHSALCTSSTPVGYLMAADRYFKRDDVGIIYQMNVVPDRQRGFVASALLKAQFERSAYGCKLYCCWCAQDLAANKFWEAMGFVPLAFRTGGTGNGKKPARMHIFWQKRIRQGDESTPWWFPGETSGGAIKENRIVLPIPPGTHWSDAKPVVLPGELSVVSGQLPVVKQKKPRQPMMKVSPIVPMNPRSIAMGGLRFEAPKPVVVKVEKPKREKQQNDPRMVAIARELKDRWLEQLNERPLLACGKYEVCRIVQGTEPGNQPLVRIEQAAAA